MLNFISNLFIINIFHMNRRQFVLTSSLTGIHFFLRECGNNREDNNDFLMTVTGSVPANKAGLTFSHEHITTDFIGAEKVRQPQYNRNDAYVLILPTLKKLYSQGVRTMVECTPNYLGRDVVLLKRLSEASGINILTNTGYYAAVDYKFLPKHFYEESIQQIGERWLKEWKDGIDGTAIRPGFIKLGVGKGPLKSEEQKLIRAAAYTHLRSGLKIAIHSGDGLAAREEQEILSSENVAPAAHIIIHSQNDRSGDVQLELARKGCWISLDGVKNSDDTISTYISFLQRLKKENVLHRVLISHDDGWGVNTNLSDGKVTLDLFGQPGDTPFAAIFEKLKPALLQQGFTEKDFDIMMIQNPAEAFAIKVWKK